ASRSGAACGICLLELSPASTGVAAWATSLRISAAWRSGAACGLCLLELSPASTGVAACAITSSGASPAPIAARSRALVLVNILRASVVAGLRPVCSSLRLGSCLLVAGLAALALPLPVVATGRTSARAALAASLAPPARHALGLSRLVRQLAEHLLEG